MLSRWVPGYFPHYSPRPPYSMPQTLQPSHTVTIPSSHQASAPAPEAPLPSSPAELPSPAPGSLSFRQLEARVDTLYSIANSASDVVVACRGDTDGTQHWIGNECKFPNSLLRDLNWQMIRKQYFFHIHSLGCNTPIQFSFLQSWDICAAAEPTMLSLLCEDSYAIKNITKKVKIQMQHPVRTLLSNCVSLNMYMYLKRDENLCIHSFPSPSLFWYNNKKACQGLPPVTTSRYSIYICAVCAAPSIHLHVCNVCKWLLLKQSIILLFCYKNIKIKI